MRTLRVEWRPSSAGEIFSIAALENLAARMRTDDFPVRLGSGGRAVGHVVAESVRRVDDLIVYDVELEDDMVEAALAVPPSRSFAISTSGLRAVEGGA